MLEELERKGRLDADGQNGIETGMRRTSHRTVLIAISGTAGTEVQKKKLLLSST